MVQDVKIQMDSYVTFIEGTPATQGEGQWNFSVPKGNGQMFYLTVLDHVRPHIDQIRQALQEGALEEILLSPPRTRMTCWEHLIQENSTWDLI